MSDAIYLKSARGEPVGDRLNVGVAGSKLLAKLLGSEPLVVGRGVNVLLVFKKPLEICLLLGAALENHQHPAESQIRRSFTLIELGPGEWMNVTGQRCAECVIDGLNDQA